MDKQQMENILSAHADGLIKGEDHSEALLSRYAAQRDTLLPLLALARLLHETLVPLTAPPEFVQTLGGGLRRGEIPETLDDRTRRAGLVGAAAVGSLLSLAGVVLLIRRRLQTRDEAVTTPAM